MEQDHNSDVNVDMEEEEEALVVNHQTEDNHDDINNMQDKMEEEEEEAPTGLTFSQIITGESEPTGAKKRKPQKTTKLQVRNISSHLNLWDQAMLCQCLWHRWDYSEDIYSVNLVIQDKVY